KRPGNLAVLVLDNEAYGETGGQASHTAHGADLCAVALACGFAATTLATTDGDIAGLRDLLIEGQGPVLAVAKISRTDVKRVMPPRDGHLLRQRFRSALPGGA